MTDINPESAAPEVGAAPEAGIPALAPEAGIPALNSGTAPGAPRHASQKKRNPLLRVTAAVAAVALGWGAFQVAQNLWAGRHDNTPISSSSHAPAGALTVSGHAVTLTFPAGWVNVPTTPNELAQFLRARTAKFPHLRAALKNQLDNTQNLRTMAMLVYRVNASGTITGNTNVIVAPATTPPRQLMPELAGGAAQFGGTHQHDSLATFGKYAAVLVTYTLPSQAGKPAEYGAQAYVHGPASTPVITVTTLRAADAAATLRQVADTIKFG
ncbi:MAG TPA: hypothetical protein VGI05_18765 [Streptosporangiaceae bacterium]